MGSSDDCLLPMDGIFSGTHKTIVLLDRNEGLVTSKSSEFLSNGISKLKFLTEDKYKGIHKTLWHVAVNAISELHRIVVDIFPAEECQMRVLLSEKDNYFLTDQWDQTDASGYLFLQRLTKPYLSNDTERINHHRLPTGLPLVCSGFAEMTKKQRSLYDEKVRICGTLQNAAASITNACNLVVFTSIDVDQDYEAFISDLKSAIDGQNNFVHRDESGVPLLRLTKLRVYVLNLTTKPVNKATCIDRQVNENLFVRFYTTNESNVVRDVHRILFDSHDLICTKLIGIPMKEDSQTDASAYNVEILHPRSFYDNYRRTSTIEIPEFTDGTTYPTVNMHWANFFYKSHKKLLFNCQRNSVRFTIAQSDNRPSVCVINFLNGGKVIYMDHLNRHEVTNADHLQAVLLTLDIATNSPLIVNLTDRGSSHCYTPVHPDTPQTFDPSALCTSYDEPELHAHADFKVHAQLVAARLPRDALLNSVVNYLWFRDKVIDAAKAGILIDECALELRRIPFTADGHQSFEENDFWTVARTLSKVNFDGNNLIAHMMTRVIACVEKQARNLVQVPRAAFNSNLGDMDEEEVEELLRPVICKSIIEYTRILSIDVPMSIDRVTQFKTSMDKNICLLASAFNQIHARAELYPSTVALYNTIMAFSDLRGFKKLRSFIVTAEFYTPNPDPAPPSFLSLYPETQLYSIPAVVPPDVPGAQLEELDLGPPNSDHREQFVHVSQPTEEGAVPEVRSDSEKLGIDVWDESESSDEEVEIEGDLKAELGEQKVAETSGVIPYASASGDTLHCVRLVEAKPGNEGQVKVVQDEVGDDEVLSIGEDSDWTEEEEEELTPEQECQLELRLKGFHEKLKITSFHRNFYLGDENDKMETEEIVSSASTLSEPSESWDVVDGDSGLKNRPSYRHPTHFLNSQQLEDTFNRLLQGHEELEDLVDDEAIEKAFEANKAILAKQKRRGESEVIARTNPWPPAPDEDEKESDGDENSACPFPPPNYGQHRVCNFDWISKQPTKKIASGKGLRNTQKALRSPRAFEVDDLFGDTEDIEDSETVVSDPPEKRFKQAEVDLDSSSSSSSLEGEDVTKKLSTEVEKVPMAAYSTSLTYTEVLQSLMYGREWSNARRRGLTDNFANGLDELSALFSSREAAWDSELDSDIDDWDSENYVAPGGDEIVIGEKELSTVRNPDNPVIIDLNQDVPLAYDQLSTTQNAAEQSEGILDLTEDDFVAQQNSETESDFREEWNEGLDFYQPGLIASKRWTTVNLLSEMYRTGAFVRKSRRERNCEQHFYKSYTNSTVLSTLLSAVERALDYNRRLRRRAWERLKASGNRATTFISSPPDDDLESSGKEILFLVKPIPPKPSKPVVEMFSKKDVAELDSPKHIFEYLSRKLKNPPKLLLEGKYDYEVMAFLPAKLDAIMDPVKPKLDEEGRKLVMKQFRER